MNGFQIATWVILGATFLVQAYTFWTLHKTAKVLKQAQAKRRASERMYSGWEK